MMLRRIFIFSLLAFSIVEARAQDSTVVKVSNFGIALYADYGKGLESVVGNQTKWEFGASLIVKKKLVLTAEYGYGQLAPQGVINNGSYTSAGNYYRAGLAYRITVAPRRYLSFGGMYASATFNDEAIVSIESELWPSINQVFTRNDNTANWVEFILNTEAPLFRAEKGFFHNFFWGARVRVRVLLSDPTQPDVDIYAIPGFGKTYSNLVPAVNFFLKYSIEL